MSDKPFDPNEDISSNLKTYHQAFAEEIAALKNETSDSIGEEARKKLYLLLPEAANTIAQLMRTGSKDDAVRLQTCKLVFEYTMTKADKRDIDDVDRIIASLKKGPVENAEA